MRSVDGNVLLKRIVLFAIVICTHSFSYYFLTWMEALFIYFGRMREVAAFMCGRRLVFELVFINFGKY